MPGEHDTDMKEIPGSVSYRRHWAKEKGWDDK
jgi:hypothetical protein